MEFEIIVVDGVEHILINRGNNEFTSMTKEHYDKTIAAQATQNGKTK